MNSLGLTQVSIWRVTYYAVASSDNVLLQSGFLKRELIIIDFVEKRGFHMALLWLNVSFRKWVTKVFSLDQLNLIPWITCQQTIVIIRIIPCSLMTELLLHELANNWPVARAQRTTLVSIVTSSTTDLLCKSIWLLKTKPLCLRSYTMCIVRNDTRY